MRPPRSECTHLARSKDSSLGRLDPHRSGIFDGTPSEKSQIDRHSDGAAALVGFQLPQVVG
ncbi:uncharacterized protein N7487_007500 [Penicillium crustosum]|uniref:uncharacterized protein n=1 Tax=Penicillium crustosum TaxID=36656 RepID=UPI0023878CF2|nr:uncharacterized protein N7487_007500 [Penicillium crustosum]KAJ5401604.1 hypothetical protein N7487_007500 [Penicillium crustosum]